MMDTIRPFPVISTVQVVHLSGRYRDRGITKHKSGDRHSAPAGCFCVEWQSGILLIEMLQC